MAKLTLRNRGIILIAVGVTILVITIIWSSIQPYQNLLTPLAYLLGGVSLFIGVVNILVFYVSKRKPSKTKEDITWPCEDCGADISESDKTCPKCGVEFEEE